MAATGAGIALPLLGAGAAHAADNGTWDKVAVCETGGLWSANTGNGFYGGLAITQDTWDEYGGDAYASRPDLASRSQQIAVAEKILADLGPDAWPGCETGTGLLDDTAPPSVDPGDTAPPTGAPGTHIPPAPTYTPPPVPGVPTTRVPSAPGTTTPASPTTPTTPTTPAAPTTPTTPTGGLPSDPSVPGAPSTTPVTPGAPTTGSTTPADPSAPATTGPAATPGSGKHAKPYSPTDEQLAAADQATRTQAYSVTEKDAPAGTTSNANSTDKTGTSSSTTPDAYTVGTGDSLSGIATSEHVDGGWQHLFDANHKVIGDDPNLIKPGQILNLG